MKKVFIWGFFGGFGVMACWLSARGDVLSAPENDLTRQCKVMEFAGLAGLPDAPTQITEVKIVAATERAGEYCSVQGYVNPQVGFEARLPMVSWNGKFMHVGCGGWCGVMNTGACDLPLRRGYACIASDMGHKGTGMDVLWAQSNLQAQIDFGYRATHVATVAGKAIAERFYKKVPLRSYFMGCSTGGYQGITAAQRFPWDFDGIISGAPDTDQAAASIRATWIVRSYLDESGKPLLSADDLQVLHRAVLARCDNDDGVADGIVGNPLSCQFEPRELECNGGSTRQCLESSKIDVVRRLYSGPMTSKGEVIVSGGYLPGSEAIWDQFWPVSALEQFFRYSMSGYSVSPQWKYTDFDFDNDYKRFGLAAHFESSNPDLRKFKWAGGKLIVYHGSNDTLVAPTPVIEYYQTVENTMGGRSETQDFFRLFMLPGVNHCAGGDGADAADFLSHLEAWVEQGKVPDSILTAHVKDAANSFQYPYRELPADPASVTFTRPVFPYPLWAKYKGKGDPNKAESFVPVGSH